jgi:hypothetical protein
MNIWEEYENRHDEFPWRERNDAVQFDHWWVMRMTARVQDSEILGTGKIWWDSAVEYMRKNYKENSPYAPGEREKRIMPDRAHDKHTTSGQALGRGVEYFFEVSGQLVNCTLPDPYVERARQMCIEKEKQELKRRLEEGPKKR